MMNLNYLAFFLIAFVPLIIAWFYYHPKSFFVNRWGNDELFNPTKTKFGQLIFAFILSSAVVYGYINLVIHQMGFYELFFTDIMLGNETSMKVVEDFFDKYRYKHRHFGHGIFHGLIIAFIFQLPFVSFQTLVAKKDSRFLLLHFVYWLITSIVIGGLISQFV